MCMMITKILELRMGRLLSLMLVSGWTGCLAGPRTKMRTRAKVRIILSRSALFLNLVRIILSGSAFFLNRVRIF